jgi:hypothetical protein
MFVASTLPSAWRACLYRSLLAAISLLIVVIALGRPGAVYGRDLAADLQMRYIHQYLGNASDDHDCGPASVAMVLDAYNLRPAGTSDARFVASIRRTMGLPANIGTVFDDLERAVSAYGLRYSLIPSSLPGEPATEYQLMRDAIDAGNLVIPLVHGAVLGRGEAYGDHWPLLVGVGDGSVHLLDPDDQAARSSDWVRGGNIMMSTSLFEQATIKAQPGPYALVIYAPGHRTPLQAGSQAQIMGTDGDGAWLRSTPAIGDNKLTLLPEGSAVTVVGPFPPPSADGHQWIGVSINGQQGYVAADYVASP